MQISFLQAEALFTGESKIRKIDVHLTEDNLTRRLSYFMDHLFDTKQKGTRIRLRPREIVHIFVRVSHQVDVHGYIVFKTVTWTTDNIVTTKDKTRPHEVLNSQEFTPLRINLLLVPDTQP